MPISDSDRGATASVRPMLLTLLGVTAFISVVDNGALFGAVLADTAGTDHRLAILLSLGLIVACANLLVLALAPGRRAFRIVAGVMLVAAAAVSYFMNNYGVIIDPSMIRNVAETDIREASPLLSAAFLLHVLGFGVVPAIVVALVPLGRPGWRRDLGHRAAVVAVSLVLLVSVVYTNYGPVAIFGHQHHALRMQINPLYPFYSLYRYAARADDKPAQVREPLAAERVAGATGGSKPTLLVFVMGETARADRFSLNGYARDTNRYTRQLDIVNFSEVSACGTSTADSVPCIFSPLGHEDFSHARFASQESLFQTLGRLGIDVAWRDNSTGCKDICDEEAFEDLAGAVHPEFCADNVCFDEILLENFAAVVADDSRDHFVVLHQRGSHGPAYYLDTPAHAKAWQPECSLAALQGCDAAALNNAYDNTILYTDYFLARVIEQVQAQSDRYQTAMLYVSDHGESLGEKGLYLHGLPYAIAPQEQTRVPMIFWGSPDFYANQAIDAACLRQTAAAPTSHDAIFHSVLSIFHIKANSYKNNLDLFSDCRRPDIHDYVTLRAGADR